MTIEKIKGHEQAQVRVYRFADGRVELVSYSTVVIVVDPEGWMTVNGLYSATTIKHIGWFMRLYGSTYHTAKQCYLDNVRMNVFTGEIENRV